MQKLYCYVDESGQDTQGDLFLVSVVITGTERDELLEALANIEQMSGKGNVKWIESKDEARGAYIGAVLELAAFKGKLHYAIYHNTKDYFLLTVQAAARAILAHVEGEYKATVLVDALQDAHVQRFGAVLRQMHIRTKKIRGVKKDETDALIRLADALCGFTRNAASGNANLLKLLSKAEEEGFIRRL